MVIEINNKISESFSDFVRNSILYINEQANELEYSLLLDKYNYLKEGNVITEANEANFPKDLQEQKGSKIKNFIQKVVNKITDIVNQAIEKIKEFFSKFKKSNPEEAQKKVGFFDKAKEELSKLSNAAKNKVLSLVDDDDESSIVERAKNTANNVANSANNVVDKVKRIMEDIRNEDSSKNNQ